MQMWRRAEEYRVRYSDGDDWRERQRRVTQLLKQYDQTQHERPRVMAAAQRMLGTCVVPLKESDRG